MPRHSARWRNASSTVAPPPKAVCCLRIPIPIEQGIQRIGAFASKWCDRRNGGQTRRPERPLIDELPSGSALRSYFPGST